MKVTLDTAGGEGDNLQARAYLAAIVGPFRRPSGRPRTAVGPTNTFVELAVNNTVDRILFVHVSAFTSGASAVLFYAQTQGGGNPVADRSETNVGIKDIILYPGEQVYGAVLTGTVNFTIYTSVF